MARGEYGLSFVDNGAAKPPSPQPSMQTPQRSVSPTDNGRGQYGQPRGTLPSEQGPWPSRSERRPWTDSQRQALQRSFGLSAIGSVAGAVLWKSHRIWGFLLGGMAGGGVGNLIFAPRDPWCDFLNR